MRGRRSHRREIRNAPSVSWLLINVYAYLWEGLVRSNPLLIQSKLYFLYSLPFVEWLK
jgi:hypothetical protein